MADRDNVTPPGDDSTAADFSPRRAPERIGPYRTLEKIGEGGMGVVYLAEQEAPLRRRVALKVIKPGMDSKQVLARFEAERQALALMNHPGVAKVFDAGSTPDGRPYFVMEHVAGVPITDYCDRHLLDNRSRLGLFIQVCEAIQHAHQRGIIHRDIKPSNVLVALEDGKPHPKVIDFGVAKATQQPLTEQTLFTQQGVLIGTPEYMSPEQAEMNALDIDTRSDVYSLGVLLYELLVGALPFEPSELRRAGFDEIRRKIREEDPPRPSTRFSLLGGRSNELARRRRREPNVLRRELLGDLDWITMRALEKDRARRYGSPTELAADVQRHLNDEVVAAGAPSTAYRVRKFASRHRLGVIAGGAIIATVLAGLGVSFFLYLRAESARKVAQEERDRARHGEYVAGVQAASAQLQLGLYDAARRQLDRSPEDLRGWEWRYLRAESRGSEITDAIHEEAVAAWNCPTGILGITRSEKIWFQPFQSHEPLILRVGGAAAPVRFAAACSWNCATLVFERSDDRLLHIVRLKYASGAPAQIAAEFVHPSDLINGFSLSSNGERMATTSMGGPGLQLWDASRGVPLSSLPKAWGQWPVLSPDGRMLAFWAAGKMHLFDLADPTGPRRIIPSTDGLVPRKFSPDGRLLAATGAGGITVIPVAGPGEAVFWEHPRGSITALDWSPDGAKLATGGSDQVVRLWELQTGSKVADFGGHGSAIESVSFSPDGSRLVSADRSGVPKLWDLPNRIDDGQARGSIYDAGFDADGRVVVLRNVQSNGNGVQCFHPSSGETLWGAEFPIPGSGHLFLTDASRRAVAFSTARFSKEGTQVFAYDGTSTMSSPRYETACPLALLPFHGGGSRPPLLAAQPSGQYAGWIIPSDNFSGCSDTPGAYILDLGANHVEHIPVRESEWEGATLTFLEDARQVAVASKHAIEVWQLAPLRLQKRLSRDGSQIGAIAHTAAGSRFAVADSNGVHIVTLSNPNARLDIAHAPNVTAMAFSPDGTRLVTGASDQTVRVFHASTGDELLLLRDHSHSIDGIRFSRDGVNLVTWSGGEVRIRKAPRS